MENNSIGETNFSDSQLIIDTEAKGYLMSASKWAQFLSILGFIACGFLVLLGLAFGALSSFMPSDMSSVFGEIPIGFFVVLYILFAVVYFFPTFFMYKFAVRTKSSLLKNDNLGITEAFKFLKRFWKFMGVMVIVVMALYFVIFIGGIITTLFLSH